VKLKVHGGKVCKYCIWKERKGKYSSCKRVLPNHIPKSAELKYRFMLVEKYTNKSCYNFAREKGVPLETKSIRWQSKYRR
jgi:hypothetical protein